MNKFNNYLSKVINESFDRASPDYQEFKKKVIAKTDKLFGEKVVLNQSILIKSWHAGDSVDVAAKKQIKYIEKNEEPITESESLKKDFPPFEQRDEFKLIGMYDLDEWFQNSKYYNMPGINEKVEKYINDAKEEHKKLKDRGGWGGIPSEDYAKLVIMTKQFCKDHNAYYYAAPKEDFFITSAMRKAKKEGKNIIVLDNLS